MCKCEYCFKQVEKLQRAIFVNLNEGYLDICSHCFETLRQNYIKTDSFLYW